MSPCTEWCIEHLFNDQATLKDICSRLDCITGKNWKYLHEKLYEGKFLSSKSSDKYEKYNHGGGNPALFWLKALFTRKSVKLTEFKTVTAPRRDIQRFFEKEKFAQLILLNDLQPSDLEELADLLYKNVIVIQTWKNFASSFGFTYTEISNFDDKKQIYNHYSPTESLLKDVMVQNAVDEFTIQQLIQCLKDITRMDCVKVLNKFIEKNEHEWQQQRQQQQQQQRQQQQQKQQQQQQQQQQLQQEAVQQGICNLDIQQDEGTKNAALCLPVSKLPSF